jgi:predicted dehydrogenase/nucleoside-diphosphate-sugar epimerase
MKSILITGVTGFIGTEFLDTIDLSKYKIIGLVRNPDKITKRHTNIVYVKFDLQNPLEDYLKLPKTDYIVHLGARPSDEKPDMEKSRIENIEATKNLIEYAKKNNTRKFIYIATNAQNKGIYSVTKKEAEEAIISSNINYVIITPGLVYGKTNRGMFFQMENFVKKFPAIPIVGNGKYKFQTVYVGDLTKFMCATLESKKAERKKYVFASQENDTYEDIIDLIIKTNELKRIKLHIPLWAIMPALNIGSKFIKLPINSDNVRGLVNAKWIDGSEAINEFGIKPTSLSDKYTELNKKIRVAVVGFGKMGLLHATLIRNMPMCKIVAVSDPKKSAKIKLKLFNYKCKYYKDYKKMIDKERIDAVFLCTPPFITQKIVEEFAQKGIAILAEKPIATDLANARNLAEIVKKHNVKNAVGYMKLYNPLFIKMKEIIKEGSMGRIKQINSCVYMQALTKKSEKWYFQKRFMGGGAIISNGVHLLSLITELLGEPKEVKSKLNKVFSEVEDEAELEFTYKNGASARLDISLIKDGYNTLFTNFEVKLQKGTITITGDKMIIKRGKEDIEYTAEELSRNTNAIFFENYDYYLQDRAFIESIRSSANLPNNFEENIKIHEIIERAYKNG